MVLPLARATYPELVVPVALTAFFQALQYGRSVSEG